MSQSMTSTKRGFLFIISIPEKLKVQNHLESTNYPVCLPILITDSHPSTIHNSEERTKVYSQLAVDKITNPFSLYSRTPFKFI